MSLRSDEDIDYFERRRYCARQLLRQLGWDRLRTEELVPPEWGEKMPIDPKRIIRMAVKYCSRNEERINKLRCMKDQEMDTLQKRDEERYNELSTVFQAELDGTYGREGQLNVTIRFLFVLHGYDLERFIADDLLPEDDVKNYKDSLRRSSAKSRRRRGVLRTLFGTASAD